MSTLSILQHNFNNGFKTMIQNVVSQNKYFHSVKLLNTAYRVIFPNQCTMYKKLVNFLIKQLFGPSPEPSFDEPCEALGVGRFLFLFQVFL